MNPSPEALHPSNPEALRRETMHNLYESMQANEEISHMTIMSGAKTELDATQRFDAATTKPGVGSQELLAFVRSGESMYSVVSFESEDKPGDKSFIVSEITAPDNPDQRPKVVGVIGEGSPIGFGLSGKEGSLRLEKNGKVVVEAGSQNINLLRPAEKDKEASPTNESQEILPEEPTAEKTAFGGLGRFIKEKKDKIARSLEGPTVEPLDLGNFGIWAPRTQEAAGVVIQKLKLEKAFDPDNGFDKEEPRATPADVEQAINKQAELESQREQRAAEAMRAAEEQAENDLKEFKGQFSEKDQHGLWMYAANLANKREAQLKEDGQASYDFERLASDGLNMLSPPAKEAAEEYRGRFNRLQSIRDKNRKR